MQPYRLLEVAREIGDLNDWCDLESGLMEDHDWIASGIAKAVETYHLSDDAITTLMCMLVVDHANPALVVRHWTGDAGPEFPPVIAMVFENSVVAKIGKGQALPKRSGLNFAHLTGRGGSQQLWSRELERNPVHAFPEPELFVEKGVTTIRAGGDNFLLPEGYRNPLRLTDFATQGPGKEVVVVSRGCLDRAARIRTTQHWIDANSSDVDGTCSWEILETYARTGLRHLKSWSETEQAHLRHLAGLVGTAFMQSSADPILLRGNGGIQVGAPPEDCFEEEFLKYRAIAKILQFLLGEWVREGYAVDNAARAYTRNAIEDISLPLWVPGPNGTSSHDELEAKNQCATLLICKGLPFAIVRQSIDDVVRLAAAIPD